MRIIISPAKKMNVNTDSLAPSGVPKYLADAETIKAWMQAQSFAQLKKLWGCNEKIAAQNYERVQAWKLSQNLTPAILSYEGIQYQYMAPAVFEHEMLAYIEEHLRILSGFYGVLRPMDGIVPYRLEMQAKAKIRDSNDLYAFWQDKLYREVIDESHTIINLASKEYSKCIEKYLQPKDVFITCVFAELSDGKVVQKGTYAKMARGEMVRFLAEHRIKDCEQAKNFNRLNYQYSEEHSSPLEYVFLRKTT